MNPNFSFRPGTWDKAIFDCVNVHNEYRLPARFNTNDIVIDIGAHIGSLPYACLTRGVGKVFAYEASYDNYVLATRNLRQFGDRVAVHYGAVWRSDKPVQSLHFTQSTNTQNTGGGNVWSSEQGTAVPAISLDSILETINKPITLLKLDCEGSEFPILFTSKRLSQIKAISGEFHEMGGQYDTNVISEQVKVEGYDKFTIDELIKFLEAEGFVVEYKRSQNPDGTPCNLGNFFAVRK